jgi:peptidoglycan/LPS O-acetylase OafA/YrhL
MEGLWGSYWSLAVEEQFYFVWPFLVFLLRQEVVAWICYLGIACALPLRIVLSHLYFGNNIGLAQITSSRVDGLFLGAASAIYLFRHKRPIPMPWILGFAAGGGAIMGYIIAFHREELVNTGKGTSLCTWGITGFALLSGALVGISQHKIWWIQRILSLKWLRAAGKYSYGMYVYHLFIFIPIRYLGNRTGLWLRLNFIERFFFFVLEAMLVFLVAKLSYDLLESRFLRLKSYFEPRKNVTVAVAALQSEP